MRDKIGTILAAIFIFAVTVFGVWAHYDGPCYLFKYSKASEIPGRCVMR